MKHINYIKADFGNVSEHFKAREFQCKDKTEGLLVATELIETLEKIRNHFNTPVIINSGYRTPNWNSKIGGTPNSYHCKGMAADIRVNGMNPKQVAKILNEIVPDECGIIVYRSWVHFDVRTNKYRKGV